MIIMIIIELMNLQLQFIVIVIVRLDFIFISTFRLFSSVSFSGSSHGGFCSEYSSLICPLVDKLSMMK